MVCPGFSQPAHLHRFYALVGQVYIEHCLVNGERQRVGLVHLHPGEICSTKRIYQRREVLYSVFQGNLVMFLTPAAEVYIGMNHLLLPVVDIEVGGGVAAFVGVPGEFEGS